MTHSISLSKTETSNTARSLMVAGILALSVAVSGCASKRLSTGSVNSKPVDQMSQTELKSAADAWEKRYKANPADKKTGLNFATALRMTGRNEQALAVMKYLAIRHSTDEEVLAAYGKALAGAGQLKKALTVIQRAQTPDTPDWRLHSAAGAIYDQLGNPKQARIEYRKALDLKPNEPSVISNLGMSYLLTGDMRGAETHLRQAIALPGADSQVRQNLALVIGLQGRFAEAETVAAGELSPQQASENIAFLRQMLSEQNSWTELKDKKVKPAG
ncbi:tetratricopeptide repeat protein [Pseudahrensia aquimaris]|uniref:Tetratricopeptide repeat protein n=1 Tax=Pseudahrensia aquimaris TaxID=744461 RepID=A0ABW3FEZ5_9HYPH